MYNYQIKFIIIIIEVKAGLVDGMTIDIGTELFNVADRFDAEFGFVGG